MPATLDMHECVNVHWCVCLCVCLHAHPWYIANLLEASRRRKYSGTLPLVGITSLQGLLVPHTQLRSKIKSHSQTCQTAWELGKHTWVHCPHSGKYYQSWCHSWAPIYLILCNDKNPTSLQFVTYEVCTDSSYMLWLKYCILVGAVPPAIALKV